MMFSLIYLVNLLVPSRNRFYNILEKFWCNIIRRWQMLNPYKRNIGYYWWHRFYGTSCEIQIMLKSHQWIKNAHSRNRTGNLSYPLVFSVLVLILNRFWRKLQTLWLNKKYPEFTACYRRIKHTVITRKLSLPSAYTHRFKAMYTRGLP